MLLEHVSDELAGCRAPTVPEEASSSSSSSGNVPIRARHLLAALESDAYRVLLARLRFPPRLAPGVEEIRLDRIARRGVPPPGEGGPAARQAAEGRAALHELRIRLKRARYAAELASPSGKARKRFLADAKTLQSLLGEHQDAVVAEERLRGAAVVDAETAAAFVAGRLAERQVARRRTVTEKFPAAWRRLRESGARLD